MESGQSGNIRHNTLDLVGYLTWAGIAGLGIWLQFTNLHPNRWLVTGLLLAFGGLLVAADLGVCETHPSAPYLYMGAQTMLVGSMLFLGTFPWVFFILPFILSAQAMMLFPQRIGYLWLLVFLVLTAAGLVSNEGGLEGLVVLPIYGGGYYFFASFANQTAQAETARRESQRLLEELRRAHAQLQAYAAQAEVLAVSQERNRLAREMHDTLGHRLTVAAVQLEGAQRLIERDPGRADEMVGTVRGQVREALGELRRTVATLRTPLEVDIPLAQALTRLVEGFEQATGISVHVDLPAELPPLSDPQRLALYRTAQEALTNIQKHAQAQEAWLRMAREDGGIDLQIEDNGVGQVDPEEGFGVRGLRERAAQLGGEVRLAPRPQGGTSLVMRLPLGQADG
jgi:signal transduction histidine kinase